MTKISTFHAIAFGVTLMTATPALSQAPVLTFGLIGDLGYRSAEEPLLQNVFDDLPGTAPSLLLATKYGTSGTEIRRGLPVPQHAQALPQGRNGHYRHQGWRLHRVGSEARGGRLSSEQVDFAQRCKAVGGTYHVVRSIDDVQRMGL